MRVSLITLGDPGRVTGGYLYHDRLARRADQHSSVVEFFSFPERAWPLPAVLGRSILRRAAAGDVIVLDSIAAALAAPWVHGARVPVVAMLHQPPGGIDHTWLRRFLQAPLDRRAYRRTRLLLAASRALADELVREGFSARKVSVVPPGRDVATSVRRPEFDLRRGRAAALLCVGNWIERKGIMSLLDAVARLPQDLATLHLVGDPRRDSAYGRDVQRRRHQADLRDRVIAHGALSIEEVAGLYAAADVFVLPSVREPYGTVFGEAMARGLPVVGVNAGNLPHLATNGTEGLIVPPGDVGALASALRRLCEDEELRAEMGGAAAARARTFPTWDETAARFFEVLRECTSRGG
jgi:glycosyltransferase involved in cell wall biosynthesis